MSGGAPSQGLAEVVEAFHLTAASRRGLRLALVGRDFTSGEPALGPYVDVIGEVDDADLAGLYQGASALVHLKAMRASVSRRWRHLSFGIPVLAADLPVLRETLSGARQVSRAHSFASHGPGT